MSDDEREEKELDLSSAEVVTKYKISVEIVNSVFLFCVGLLCAELLHFGLIHNAYSIEELMLAKRNSNGENNGVTVENPLDALRDVTK